MRVVRFWLIINLCHNIRHTIHRHTKEWEGVCLHKYICQHLSALTKLGQPGSLPGHVPFFIDKASPWWGFSALVGFGLGGVFSFGGAFLFRFDDVGCIVNI